VSSYGRPQFAFPRLTSTVKALIIGLLGAYVAQLVLHNWLGVPIASWLAMQPASLAAWQLVTYVVIDLGHPLMFLIGLLFIWWALSPFEIAYGPRRTLQLCLAVTLGASLPAWLMGFVIAGSPVLFGSHVLWFGGITATTWLYRGRQMSLFGIGSMTGQQFLLVLVGLSVLMFLASKNHTQLIGDLGAMGSGILFMRWLMRPRGRSPVGRSRKKGPSARAKGFRVIDGGGSDPDERPKYLN
jgi:hypothetical protein